MYLTLTVITIIGYYVYKFRNDYKPEDLEKITVTFGIIGAAFILISLFLGWIFG